MNKFIGNLVKLYGCSREKICNEIYGIKLCKYNFFIFIMFIFIKLYLYVYCINLGFVFFEYYKC